MDFCGLETMKAAGTRAGTFFAVQGHGFDISGNPESALA
jgi:hypothetical protein